jgi:hypothetical protein
MQEEEVIAELISLVEGKIAPAAWVSWWSENSTQLQTLLPRTAFLKLKPNVVFGDTRAALVSQAGALEYLHKKGIAAVRADKYAIDWQNQETEREAQSSNTDKIAKENFATSSQQLKQNFPALYKCLKKHLSSVDVITPGKSASAILTKAKALQCQFSDSQQLFMQSVSVLQLDGVKYDFNDIRWLETASMKYLVWGEYWLEGDGDLLLSDPASDTMHYLSHGSKGLQPKQLSANFYEFIEHDLVEFIVENEE